MCLPAGLVPALRAAQKAHPIRVVLMFRPITPMLPGLLPRFHLTTFLSIRRPALLTRRRRLWHKLSQMRPKTVTSAPPLNSKITMVPARALMVLPLTIVPVRALAVTPPPTTAPARARNVVMRRILLLPRSHITLPSHVPSRRTAPTPGPTPNLILDLTKAPKLLRIQAQNPNLSMTKAFNDAAPELERGR